MEYSRAIDVTAPPTSPSEEVVQERAQQHAAPDERTRDLAGPPQDDDKFNLSLGVIFPLLGGRSTLSHEHLLPIFVSLVVALMLMAAPFPWLHLMMHGEPAPAGVNQSWQIFSILAIYIAFMINYYINQMCGHARSGWFLAFVSVLTFWLLTTPFWDFWYNVFYNVIPGQRLEKSSNPFAVIAGDILGTGLSEEGFKAIPLIGLATVTLTFGFLSRRTSGRLSALLHTIGNHFGLRDPLDGIVLGAASGTGFFIYETLVQYVPMAVSDASHPANAEFDGLVQLLARGLPELTAHSAYSGLFGYFIGLAVLRPGMAVVLVPLGWLSASILHGAWDATSDLIGADFIGLPVSVTIGVLSYALLAGAIFKARDISPSFAHRCQNYRPVQ